MSKSITSELVQVPTVCVVPTFSYEDLDRVLAGPTIKILDRYDYHSVLQFLLMKLRTASGSLWLNELSELRKVSFFNFSQLLFRVLHMVFFNESPFILVHTLY